VLKKENNNKYIELKNIAVSGSGSNLQSIIDSVDNGNINGKIQLVISNRKSAYGLERAKNHNIEALFVSKKEAGSLQKYDERIVQLLDDRKIDLVVLAGYLNILTPHFINSYKNKIVNIHPSLIPSFCGKGYYGLHVHEAAVNYGVKVSGATVHFVDEGTDTGAIIIQDTVNVDSKDTAEDLQKKVLILEHQLLPKAVQLFCDDKIKLEDRKVKIV
jgi:phosphoribosylglycinamide formyltransferase-1